MYRVGAFYGGLAALFVALVSPIDALAGALFSFHMVQHLLLMLVAAPLLVLGAPPVALAWAAPRSALPGLGRWWRRQHALGRLWKGLAHPLAAWVLHALAVWVWHMPGPYQAALRSETIHFLEHFSFLATALLFWWVLARCGEPGKLSYAGGIFYVFTTALHSGVLGALMTFSRTVWYPIYTSTAAEWGLTALEDQQLAGSIMWVPANFFYLIATLVLLWKWFEGLERKDTARQPDLGQTGG